MMSHTHSDVPPAVTAKPPAPSACTCNSLRQSLCLLLRTQLSHCENRSSMVRLCQQAAQEGNTCHLPSLLSVVQQTEQKRENLAVGKHLSYSACHYQQCSAGISPCSCIAGCQHAHINSLLASASDQGKLSVEHNSQADTTLCLQTRLVTHS